MRAPLRLVGDAECDASLGRPSDVAPYTVRKYPALGGAARLLGYDAQGEPIIELVLDERRATMGVVRQLQRLMREIDGPRHGREA